jgi:ATP-dependent DNA helicase RecG
VSERNGIFSIMNPKIESVSKVPFAVGSSLFGEEEVPEHALYPVYPESRGITSNWMYHCIQKIFKSGILENIVDPIPEDILKKYKLPGLKTALIWVHTPRKQDDALSARKRFAFEEIFFIQLRRQRDRNNWRSHQAFRIDADRKKIETLINRFPFPLTKAQERSIDSILEDFKKPYPMSRLLEGDVGSGKTAVAAAVAYATITTRPKGQDFGTLQVAYMAPTEILASQHFESFIEYFKDSGISVGLITGSGCRKFPSKVNPSGWTDISRTQLLKWVANGEIPILVGTHSLIQKTVKFKHLGLVVIDEQHRFGTAQRQKLREKEGLLPHLLTMTATPIPRTLALTIYGDLDLSLLDELPVGRRNIETEIVLPSNRDKIYEHIRKEIKSGRQAYVICPRINEPDPDKEKAILAKSVIEEAKRLKKEIFKEFEIGVLHGKMTPKKKDEVMKDFSSGKLQILAATSVVEVGVNVPNATVIIIEGGERFGLAQLHQLRGRVMRSSYQPYCFIFAETKSKKSIERLRAITKAKNGFELAEYDLSQRGAGDLSGKKQWGLTDLGMEAIKNIKMVEAARNEAEKLINNDPKLKIYPNLQKELDGPKESIHFE